MAKIFLEGLTADQLMELIHESVWGVMQSIRPPKTNPETKYLTRKETARRLKVSLVTLTYWVNRGRIVAHNMVFPIQHPLGFGYVVVANLARMLVNPRKELPMDGNVLHRIEIECVVRQDFGNTAGNRIGFDLPYVFFKVGHKSVKIFTPN